MDSINIIPYEDVPTADLLVDSVYKAGEDKDLRSEVLSKLMHIGNVGGFRKCKKSINGKKINDVGYVCIFSTGEELEWCDELDRTLGRFIYWGDNRKAGNPIDKTSLGGNAFLQDIFRSLSAGNRYAIAPIFVFQKYTGRDAIFLGLAVPGDRRTRPQDALVAIWAQNSAGRYQNYKAIFTILDVSFIDRRWLDDLEAGIGYDSPYAPDVWKKWVDKGTYKPLITDKNPVQYRRAYEQLPSLNSPQHEMLQSIIEYFKNPYEFEACACKIAQMMDPNIIYIDQTQRARDGGRDAVGKYRVGPQSGGIELEFALEAKRYNIENPVGVKETSRLISRIKNRQFGIFVTTSYLGSQAYKEIIEDQHPVIVISGKDIIDILVSSGITDKKQLALWLKANF